MKYLVFTLSFFLAACSSTQPAVQIKKVQLTQVINHSLFKRVETPNEHSVFELSEPEKEKFFHCDSRGEVGETKTNLH